MLGLEEGVLPRRSAEAPFVSDEVRAGLETRAGRRLVRPDQIARERYLFYTACTRAWRRLCLVREAATEEGTAARGKPFYDEVRSRFAERRSALDAAAAAVRALWELHAAPTERERMRSVAVLQSKVAARSLAASARWSRRLDRALAAFSRATRLVNPRVLERSASRHDSRSPSSRRSATARRCGSSTGWSTRARSTRSRSAAPRTGRAPSALPVLCGAAQALRNRRRRSGSARRKPSRSCTSAWRRRSPARFGSSWGLDLLELEGTLGRDLEHFIEQDTARGLPLVPRRFEVSFGTERAAPELQRGIDLDGFTVSGKIDRIDVDPLLRSRDRAGHKSGAAHSARRIEQDRRLQVPLYVLALRDLVGIEPLGGLYRSLSGEREAEACCVLEAQSDVPGFASLDYLDEDAFWE